MITKMVLKPKQVLTYDQLYQILNKARVGYDYVRFDTHNKREYIMVCFNRDNTISITTNSRDYTFYIESQIIIKDRGPFTRLVQFMFKWLPKLNNK